MAKVGIKNEKYKREVVEKIYSLLHDRVGAINEVAKRTGYHRETVRLTFAGKLKKPLPIVMEKATEVLAEYNEQHRKTMAALSKVVNN